MWWFPSKNICQKSSGSVLMNFWRWPLYWSLIFCKTYKFLCDVWCVMRDVFWFKLDFFVRSWLYESRGDQRYPIWVISDLFNDIPKLIPGGSSMYTISCKASYRLIESNEVNIPLLWHVDYRNCSVIYNFGYCSVIYNGHCNTNSKCWHCSLKVLWHEKSFFWIMVKNCVHNTMTMTSSPPKTCDISTF